MPRYFLLLVGYRFKELIRLNLKLVLNISSVSYVYLLYNNIGGIAFFTVSFLQKIWKINWEEKIEKINIINNRISRHFYRDAMF